MAHGFCLDSCQANMVGTLQALSRTTTSYLLCCFSMSANRSFLQHLSPDNIYRFLCQSQFWWWHQATRNRCSAYFTAPCWASERWYAFQPGQMCVCSFHRIPMKERGFASAFVLSGHCSQRGLSSFLMIASLIAIRLVLCKPRLNLTITIPLSQ